MKNKFLLLIIIVLTYGCKNDEKNHTPLDKLIGHIDADLKPELFATTVFKGIENYRDITFTPDLQSFYFTEVINGEYRILHSNFDDTKWSIPSVTEFSDSHNTFEPFISPDGQKFYFASSRPSELKDTLINDFDIWLMNRNNDTWSKPELLKGEINTNCMEYNPSASKNDNICFCRNNKALTRGDIFMANYNSGKYVNIIKLPETVNFPNTSFNAFLAPDESYIIFSSYIQTDTLLHSDLFVSFRKDKNTWTKAQSIGHGVNSKYNEISPYVSPDGKYLFFSSARLDSSNQNNYKIFVTKTNVLNDLKNIK